MNEIAIIEIDNLLGLVDAARTNTDEIIIMEKAGLDPVDEQSYYEAANYLLGWRSKYNPNTVAQQKTLSKIAEMEGIILVEPAFEVPQVNIPIFAMGM